MSRGLLACLDLTSEIRSFFGSGTQLQELYITPSSLSSSNWDELAAAAKWSSSSAPVLRDTHWVGGDPLALQVYGWAAWSKDKGTLVLRNPDAADRELTLDIGQVFELPTGAATRYTLTSPYADQRLTVLELDAGAPHTFQLRPFEVLVFDAKPR